MLKIIISFTLLFCIRINATSFFVNNVENHITAFLNDSIKVSCLNDKIIINKDIYEFRINKTPIKLKNNKAINVNVYNSVNHYEDIKFYQKINYGDITITLENNKLHLEFNSNFEVYKNNKLVNIDDIKYFKINSPNLLSENYKLNHSTRLGAWFHAEVNSLKVDNEGNTYLIMTSEKVFPEMESLIKFGYAPFQVGNGYTTLFTYDKFNDIKWITLIGSEEEHANYDLEINQENIYFLNMHNSWLYPRGLGDKLILNEQKNNFQKTNRDIAIFKLDIEGKVLFSTFNGGFDEDIPYDMIIDENKNAWITGITVISGDLFWTSENAINKTKIGGVDAFVMCLTPENECIYSSFYGTTDDDYIFSICEFDSLVIMAGMKSKDFENTQSGRGYLIAINKNTYEVEWEKLIGKDEFTSIQNIQRFDNNSMIISGYTNESNLATSGVYSNTNYELSKFVAIIDNKGKILKSTYLGGEDMEGEITTNKQYGDVFLDEFKNVYTIFSSKSENLETTDSAFSKSNSGMYDIGINVLDRNLKELKYSTYFGGRAEDFGHNIVKHKNSIYFTGKTNSMDIPLTPDAIVNYRYYRDTNSFSGLYTRITIPRFIDSCLDLKFSVNDFREIDDFNLVGDAVVYDSILRLTREAQFEKSAIWYNEPISLRNGFSSEITFKIIYSDNLDENGADGFAFVIQTESIESLGNSGGGIGYEGINNAFAVELDLFQNKTNYADSNNNHIAIFSNESKISSNHNSENLISQNFDIPQIKRDGSLYKLFVIYDSEFNKLSVILEDENFNYENVLELEDFDLSKYINLEENDNVFIGITSSTGDKFQRQEILNWKFCGGVETSSINNIEEQDIALFPNPANEYFTINGINNNEIAFIEIYDIIGNKILSKNISSNDKIDIDNLNRGVYFVKITFDNEPIIKKLIINN